MPLNTLTAISPLDGRYAEKTKPLATFFSEYALIKGRILVEVEYFIALCELPLPQLKNFNPKHYTTLRKIVDQFSEKDAWAIKDIEQKTNHDVKAVEYFLKNQWETLGLANYKEFIHFGLTSQDINNTAMPLLLKQAMAQVYRPHLCSLQKTLEDLAKKWGNIPMLAHTHGQPASPTKVGKELRVFYERLAQQVALLEKIPYTAKLGGATGNFNAHYVAYPTIDWHQFADNFIMQKLQLKRSHPTTQIEHYDFLATLFDNLKRINTILLDFSKDLWQYIAMGYFKQKIQANEVGSSTMPHKVNPIDFENAEGNLGIANALFAHLAAKLPISRLQRDLTDSTVLRNLGVPLGHTLIALQSLKKGLEKLTLCEATLRKNLTENWAIVAEGIQNILRREGYPQPYEALKALTRNNESISAETISQFIDSLAIDENIKRTLKAITPFNYTGVC